MKSLFLFTLTAAAALAQSPLQLKVSMISLGIKDPATSIKFYGEKLGLQMIGKPGEVTQFKAGEITIALNHPAGQAAGKALAGSVEIIFPVESVVATHSILAERGCLFLAPPREIFPGTWAATLTDPDGHRLTILGPH